MSSAASSDALLTNMEQAEKDLAMYAAIIGHRPQVSPADAQDAMEDGGEGIEAVADHTAHQVGRMSIWMHRISDHAKRRLHEAKMRLAS